jgi:hypothetical protein
VKNDNEMVFFLKDKEFLREPEKRGVARRPTKVSMKKITGEKLYVPSKIDL